MGRVTSNLTKSTLKYWTITGYWIPPYFNTCQVVGVGGINQKLPYIFAAATTCSQGLMVSYKFNNFKVALYPVCLRPSTREKSRESGADNLIYMAQPKNYSSEWIDGLKVYKNIQGIVTSASVRNVLVTIQGRGGG